MGSLQLGSSSLGPGLFGSLSTIEKIGETGSGDNDRADRVSFSGVTTRHGPGALLSCSSCNKQKLLHSIVPLSGSRQVVFLDWVS